MKKLKLLCLSLLCLFSLQVYANSTPDIVGKWRSIDDQTGFSKGIVEITKDAQGIYHGKIIEVVPRPGYSAKTICEKCPEPYTNQAIIGLEVLTGMKASNTPLEYSGGTILDPISGRLYKSKVKLNTTGSRLSLRGFVGVEVIGRSQTWIREQ